jgi:hypothetical protein
MLRLAWPLLMYINAASKLARRILELEFHVRRACYVERLVPTQLGNQVTVPIPAITSFSF